MFKGLETVNSPCHGWYVALAEIAGAPLASLDHRLLAAAGSACEFLTPPS